MPIEQDGQRFYTTTEATMRTGRSPDMLKRWIVSGALPATKFFDKWAIREDHLLAVDAQHPRAGQGR